MSTPPPPEAPSAAAPAPEVWEGPGRRDVVRAAATIAVVALFAYGVAPRMNEYHLQVLNLAGIAIVMAVSLNLINGYAGQFSLGHAGFMAIGAYASAALTFYPGPTALAFLEGTVGAPAWLANALVLNTAMLAGGLLAAAAGLVVGIPTLRLRGDYLAIATLGFGEIIRVVILNLDFVGGARGFSGIAQMADTFWIWIWAVATVVVIGRMVGSTRGIAFLTVREDEIAAEALGISTTRAKVTAFVVGAFFAGLGGGLFAHFQAYLHTNSFTFMRSIELVAMVVLGGMGSITGSIVAAILLTGLPELLRGIAQYRMVLYSLLLIVLMLVRPQGLLGTREVNLAGIAARVRRRLAGEHAPSAT